MSLFVYKLIPPRPTFAQDMSEAERASEGDPAIASGMATMELSPMAAAHVRV